MGSDQEDYEKDQEDPEDSEANVLSEWVTWCVAAVLLLYRKVQVQFQKTPSKQPYLHKASLAIPILRVAPLSSRSE